MEKVKHTYVLSLGLGLSIAFSSFSAIAQEHFNPRLLETDSTETPMMDLSLFAKDEVPPGDYNVDIYINGSLVDTKTISFRKLSDDKNTTAGQVVGACLSVSELKAWNVRVDNYFSEQDKTSECASLQAIPGLEQKMDLANQRFDLTIPQVALLNTARGYVSPER